MKGRLAIAALVAGGVLLWKAGFGFLPTERRVSFALPVAAGDVRRLELELWQAGGLLARREEQFPAGLTHPPEIRIALARGAHEAIAHVWLASEGGARRVFRLDFDPKSDDDVLVQFVR